MPDFHFWLAMYCKFVQPAFYLTPFSRIAMNKGIQITQTEFVLTAGSKGKGVVFSKLFDQKPRPYHSPRFFSHDKPKLFEIMPLPLFLSFRPSKSYPKMSWRGCLSAFVSHRTITFLVMVLCILALKSAGANNSCKYFLRRIEMVL